MPTTSVGCAKSGIAVIEIIRRSPSSPTM
jgi:hypothetical protein